MKDCDHCYVLAALPPAEYRHFSLSKNFCYPQTCSSIFFDVHVTVHRDEVLIINQLDALISQIYFWNENLQVSDSSSVHHQEFFKVHTGMVYFIQFC